MTLPQSPFLSAEDLRLADTAPADERSPLAAGATDCIGEIFIGAEKLNDPEARFVFDEERFMIDLEEPPLFLRRAAG